MEDLPEPGPIISAIKGSNALDTAECKSACVLATTRAVNVLAFMPWSANKMKYVFSAFTMSGSVPAPSM